MISYMDRCCWQRSEWQCVNRECDRFLGDGMIAEAETLNLPISVADLKTDTCGHQPKDAPCANGS